MTSFEHYFSSLKKVLGKTNLYDIWPNFEPEYDKKEFAWTNLRGLGETLLLNCGKCDGPSDMRHDKCIVCVNKRKDMANSAYNKAMGRQSEKWSTIVLCRIHTDQF